MQAFTLSPVSSWVTHTIALFDLALRRESEMPCSNTVLIADINIFHILPPPHAPAQTRLPPAPCPHLLARRLLTGLLSPTPSPCAGGWASLGWCQRTGPASHPLASPACLHFLSSGERP